MKGEGSIIPDAVGLDWEIVDRRRLLSCPVFNVYQSGRRSCHGRVEQFFYLDLANWVTVIPRILREGVPHFVMVRQFRHGVEKQMLEFPAGVIDPGESPLQAALRELLEETGYHTERLTPLGECHPNPALMNNRNYTFLADIRAKAVAQPLQLDDNELLENLVLSQEQLEAQMASGGFSNAMMLQAYSLYLLFKKREDSSGSSTSSANSGLPTSPRIHRPS